MYTQILTVLVVLGVAHGFSLSTLNPCSREIDGGKISLGCIVLKFCSIMNGKDAALKAQTAQDFFGCYSGRLGEKQFLDCQQAEFGGLLNGVENDEKACKIWSLETLPNLAKYAACLTPAFQNAKVNGTAAVTAVNRCQGAALGLKVTEVTTTPSP